MTTAATESSALPAVGMPAPPCTFDDILGRASAVAGLRKRVQMKTHATGLILHGPAGVGKRTLARLYAKAVLCGAPTPSGSPCNQCASCVPFDAAGNLGFVELDVNHGLDVERARDLAKRMHGPSLPQQRVIIIANADASVPEAFDVLLKTLEETQMGTTFILLASDLKSVRLSRPTVLLQSRPG